MSDAPSMEDVNMNGVPDVARARGKLMLVRSIIDEAEGRHAQILGSDNSQIRTAIYVVASTVTDLSRQLKEAQQDLKDMTDLRDHHRADADALREQLTVVEASNDVLRMTNDELREQLRWRDDSVPDSFGWSVAAAATFVWTEVGGKRVWLPIPPLQESSDE